MAATRLGIRVAAALAALATPLMLCACQNGDSSAAPAPQVLAGTTVVPTSPITVPEGEPLHLTVPSVGVDAEVDPVEATEEGIDPPTLDAVGWWTGRGAPGSSDTVYIAGHAVDTGEGAFTPLQNVAPGADIELDTTTGVQHYRVDSIVLYDKDTLESVDDVWASVPGRLMLVTCYLENGDTVTDDNYVVYSTLMA